MKTWILGLAVLVTGCTHAPDFERSTPPSVIGPGPLLEPLAFVRVEATPETDARFAEALGRAMRISLGVAPVASGVEPDYVARVAVETRASASGANFLICWPGFIAFAPAWHGLDWRYSVETHLLIESAAGEVVAARELRGHWLAHYTPALYGATAELGWVLYPLDTMPALVAGLATSYVTPDKPVLDDAFVARDGLSWADEVVAVISLAIERDRASHPIER
ncbi:MAG TPA: hypothetical protein VFF73_01785 [Planctomycetota bacterium]|nr:hypothetical protein [Planctomycetota bacterium]